MCSSATGLIELKTINPALTLCLAIKDYIVLHLVVLKNLNFYCCAEVQCKMSEKSNTFAANITLASPCLSQGPRSRPVSKRTRILAAN